MTCIKFTDVPLIKKINIFLKKKKINQRRRRKQKGEHRKKVYTNERLRKDRVTSQAYLQAKETGS